MVRPITLENQINDLVTPVVRKIDVDVGKLLQLHPLRIEKSPEIQFEANRTNRADPQAIANQRIRRAPPRDPFDPAIPATLQQLPNDEEIFLVAHLRDDLQLLLDLVPHPGTRHRPITLPHSLARQTPEKLPRRGTIRRNKPRKLQPANRQHEFAPRRNLLRIPHHTRRDFDFPRPRKIPPPFPRMRLPRQRQSPDTLHHLVKLGVLRRRIPNLRKRGDRTQNQSAQRGIGILPMFCVSAQQPAQIPIPRCILHISQIPNPSHLHLRPHDRLDARLPRRRTKLHHPVQIRIRQSHRLHPPLHRHPHHIPWPQQRIHEAEAALHIQ